MSVISHNLNLLEGRWSKLLFIHEEPFLSMKRAGYSLNTLVPWLHLVVGHPLSLTLWSVKFGSNNEEVKWEQNFGRRSCLIIRPSLSSTRTYIIRLFWIISRNSEANFKGRCDLLNNWPPQRLIGSVMNCAILVGACLIQAFLPKYIWTCCICVFGSTFVLLLLLHCSLAACVYNLDSLTFASMVSLTSHIHSSSKPHVGLIDVATTKSWAPVFPFNCAFLHLVHHNDESLVSSFTVMETKGETGDPLPKVTSSSSPSITTWTRFFPILHCSVVHFCFFSPKKINKKWAWGGGRENFTSLFNLKNMISTHTQRFLLNKWLTRFQTFYKIVRFLQQIPAGSQNINKILIFFYFQICPIAKFG